MSVTKEDESHCLWSVNEVILKIDFYIVCIWLSLLIPVS